MGNIMCMLGRQIFMQNKIFNDGLCINEYNINVENLN